MVLKCPSSHLLVEKVHLDDAVLIQFLLSENGLVPDPITVDEFQPVQKQVLLLGGHCPDKRKGQKGQERTKHL